MLLLTQAHSPTKSERDSVGLGGLVQVRDGDEAIPPSWRQKSLINQKGGCITSKNATKRQFVPCRQSTSLWQGRQAWWCGARDYCPFAMVGKALSPL